jgi:DNA-binding transcriptional ArsR family regulator
VSRETFDALKAVLVAHSKGLRVTKDEAMHFQLHTAGPVEFEGRKLPNIYFAWLKEGKHDTALHFATGLSDSALSNQLSVLEGAGYVTIRKSFVGKWPRTSVSLSKQGRNAFKGHVTALQQIVASAGSSLRAG